MPERRNVSEISKGSKSRVENFTEREMIVEEGRQRGHIEADMLESSYQNREIDEAYNHIHFQRVRPVILRIFSPKWELIATVSKLSFYQSI